MCVLRSPDGHAGQQLRLQAVGLQGRQLAQHRPQLFGLDGGHGVRQNGGPAVVAQPADGLLRQVGLQHHQVRPVDEIQPLPQEIRGHAVIDGHVVDSQCHVPVGPGDVQIGAGAAVRQHGAGAQVQADVPGVFLDPAAEVVVAHHRHHGGLLAQQTQVVGDVAAHAAQGRGHMAGIGVPGHQLPGGHRADVHVHAAYHRHIRGSADNVALAGDAALFHQVGYVHRHAGAGDAGLVRQLLLRDRGVFPDPLQQLALSLGHRLTS